MKKTSMALLALLSLGVVEAQASWYYDSSASVDVTARGYGTQNIKNLPDDYLAQFGTFEDFKEDFGQKVGLKGLVRFDRIWAESSDGKVYNLNAKTYNPENFDPNEPYVLHYTVK